MEKLLVLVQGRSRLEADRSIEQVKQFVAKNFRETLKISYLAKLAGTSVSTFSRRFQRSTGVGLEKFIQNLQGLRGSPKVAQVRQSADCPSGGGGGGRESLRL